MKHYFYCVYSNRVPMGGGSLVVAEKLAKELKKRNPSHIIEVEKTPLTKRKGGWRA